MWWRRSTRSEPSTPRRAAPKRRQGGRAAWKHLSCRSSRGALRGLAGRPHRPPYRNAPARHVVGDPLRRRPGAACDDGGRQLRVVVVEHLEAVVSPVPPVVEDLDELGEESAVQPLSRKDAEMPRGVDALLYRGQLAPHEIRELNEKDLLRVDEVELVEGGARRELVEGVEPEPEVRAVRRGDDVRSEGKL